MWYVGTWWRGLVGVSVPLVVAGCSVISSAEKEYASNRDCLEDVARVAAYEVDPAQYELLAADVREDSLTFQYRGVVHAGDSAWVVRFSSKSTEQDPASLLDPYRILPVIAEGRSGFAFVSDGERKIDGKTARWIRYRFESPIRDDASRPLPGRGMLVTIALGDPESPVIFHLKLDNYGDREELRWDDLRALLAPLGLNP